MWLGGINGVCLNDAEQSKYPGIMRLGKMFSEFQNSPYRGEWNQKCPSLNMGEVRELLLEVAGMIKSTRKHPHD